MSEYTSTANQSLAIVGKSSLGKSTLMHVTALLDVPTSGTIELS
ncbi:ATP-binding cassette domain-containing protein [Glaciibacter flavus]|nr:ATP-binding cassette domain-containing protein [Glaciibacter flavus]